MKKILLPAMLARFSFLGAQFKVSVAADAGFAPKEAYFYTTNGSKDILAAREIRSGNSWQFSYPKHYVGMMKVYFPETNTSLNFISENKDVSLSFTAQNGKIRTVNYLDEANRVMNDYQKDAQKRELILPALQQMKDYYTPDAEFSAAINKEIARLSAPAARPSAAQHPFVSYYTENFARYAAENPAVKPKNDDILNFIVRSDEMLESSMLLRPVLTTYLQNAGAKVDGDVDKLLDALDVESPRGQTVLSEFIDIFDAYGLTELKQKYLAKATNLKCTITDRLAGTLKANKNTEIGAKFPDYQFQHPTNTAAKSIYGVKASKKLIIFWSSTCSHCEAELPKLIPHLADLKAKGVEIIGLSLDSDRASYERRIKDFPWINDSELRGWYSSFADTYNVHATPTYYILDGANTIIAKPDHMPDVLSALGAK